MNGRQPRYAFAVHPYGAERANEASSLAARLARRFQAWSEVEILTTCATGEAGGANVLPAGHSRVDGVHVRRFPVDRARSARGFARSSRYLWNTSDPSLEEQEAWLRGRGPFSSRFIDYLETFGNRYDAFLFFDYRSANSYFGLPIVEERAFLLPLAHDEPPIGLSMWERYFARPRGFFFNSAAEEHFLRERFPNLPLRGSIAGFGLGAQADADPQRFRATFGLRQPFLLYLGRVDPDKGCYHLLEDFTRYRAGGGRYRDLAIVGETHMPLPRVEGVHWIGGVDERTKWDALAACDVVVIPARNETFSLTALEAWSAMKPVVVSAQATAVVSQCRSANGGLWYANADELAAALDLLDVRLRERLGAQGRAFAADGAVWLPALETYRAELAGVNSGLTPRKPESS